MKWFKHFTDNHRGRTIQHAFNQLGYQAYAVYVIMELCAEKLEKKESELTEEDCVFTFNRVHFQSVLRLKRVGCDSVLNLFSELGWFSSSRTENEIIIKFPMLLDLLEYDQKKSRHRRASVARKNRLDTETDTDKEYNIIGVAEVSAIWIAKFPGIELGEKLKQAYCEEIKSEQDQLDLITAISNYRVHLDQHAGKYAKASLQNFIGFGDGAGYWRKHITLQEHPEFKKLTDKHLRAAQ